MNNPLDFKATENKLAKLQECITALENLKKTPKEEFLKNKEKRGAAMYYLVIGVEVITDISQHILSEVFQIRGESYREIILKLGEVKIVDEKFAKQNASLAGLRNLLIHDYTKVDLTKVYHHLQRSPDVFRKFAKYFQKFLDKIKTST